MHLEIIFKDPNRKKIFLSKTKTLCAVILSYHLLTWFTGCPFRFFFGISCPGCGMTRALLAALLSAQRACGDQHSGDVHGRPHAAVFPAGILSRSLD